MTTKTLNGPSMRRDGLHSGLTRKILTMKRSWLKAQNHARSGRRNAAIHLLPLRETLTANRICSFLSHSFRRLRTWWGRSHSSFLAHSLPYRERKRRGTRRLQGKQWTAHPQWVCLVCRGRICKESSPPCTTKPPYSLRLTRITRKRLSSPAKAARMPFLGSKTSQKATLARILTSIRHSRSQQRRNGPICRRWSQ